MIWEIFVFIDIHELKSRERKSLAEISGFPIFYVLLLEELNWVMVESTLSTREST